MMNTTKLTLLLFAAAAPALAQTGPGVTVGASYTYVRANLVPGCNCIGLNGGSGEVGFRLSPRYTALADVTLVHRGGITQDNYTLTQLTYTAGVRAFPIKPKARLRPFVEGLIGAAHVSGTLAPSSTGEGPSNSFALQAGGGITYRLTPHFILRPVQADYLLTTLSNNAKDKQNDLRLSAGVDFRFGH